VPNRAISTRTGPPRSADRGGAAPSLTQAGFDVAAAAVPLEKRAQPLSNVSATGGDEMIARWTRMLALVLVVCGSGCDQLLPADDDDDTGIDGGSSTYESGDHLTQVENDLLAHINTERTGTGLPALQRDPGMDLIEYWYNLDMLMFHRLNHHIDRNDRNSEARARYYGDDPAIRCSEIIQWWGGTPDGEVHYDGYFNSPPHHDAYMEVGAFNLGPTSWAGVAAVEGYGPIGTEYEDRKGSYTGVMFCDHQVTIVIDPFSED